MATKTIFRDAALERLSTPERLDQGLTVVGTASWALLWGLVLLVVGGLAWSIIVVVPVTVKGEGILLSPGGVLDVTSGSQGRVTKLLVETGDAVKTGETVAELDQPQLRQDLASAEGELKDLQNERRQTVDFQQRRNTVLAVTIAQKRRALAEDIDILVKNIDLLEQQAKVQDELQRKGYTTQEKVLQGKLELGRQQEELAHNRTNLKEIDDQETKARTDDERELLTVDLKIASAERKANALRDRFGAESKVTSPYEGKVAELKVNTGELVERGTALFTLVPKNAESPTAESPTIETAPSAGPGQAAMGPLVAVLYVAPTYGKQVRPGATVEVAVSTARREEYGFVIGRVRSVAEIPSTAEGMQRVLKNKQLVQTMSNNAAPFEIVADLYADPETPSGYRWSSSHGPNLKINSGTLVDADIEVRDLPILSLVIPQMRTLLETVHGWFDTALASPAAPGPTTRS
jgi:HlyD family secretion protein